MRIQRTHLLAALIAVAALAPWRDAVADDETDDIEIKVQAPLDAVDCAATPPTVTVLGLPIDISQVAAEDSENDSSGETEDDSSGGGSSTCAALVVGQTVEVKLASDAVPLAATELGGGGEGESSAEIKAPVQSVDAANGTVTVLGLTVDVSQANLEGDDDEGDGEGQGGQPIDLTQVTAGQSVEIKLDASKLPALVASEISVKNFANQVELDIEDSQGEDIGDDDSVDVSVSETVVVQDQSGTRVRRVRKVVQFTQTGHGRVVLGGLPTGRALITVSRSGATATEIGKRRTKVLPNTRRAIRVRMHSH